MSKNAYSELVDIMQRRGGGFNPPSIKIATVLYVEETDDEVLDIKIEVDDLTINKDNIYISDYLLKEHQREVKTSGDGITWSNRSYIKTRDTLKTGDLVAVMPVEGKQTYIILSRIVRVGGSDE